MPAKEATADRVAREDLLMFVNACFVCTGQREFYGDAHGQTVSIVFLHQYILGNYRRLYARTLASKINHFNQALVIVLLLSTGKDTPEDFRREENELITQALRRLPPQRVYRLFQSLRRRQVNNRRTRAIVRDYIANRDNHTFDCLKYRRLVTIAVTHNHLRLPGELGKFLFESLDNTKFENELLETYRQVHFSQNAVYRLPFTIAEGLAAKHKIPRARFLEEIQGMMTKNEKLRHLQSADKNDVRLNFDLGKAGLTRAAIYISSLPLAERRKSESIYVDAMENSARRCYKDAQYPMGKVAMVLDRSYSSSGSSEKRRRPLALAIAVHYLLKQAAKESKTFWTPSLQGPSIMATPQGQSDIATPLLHALEWQPDTIVIVSDGYENAPPGAASQLIGAYNRCLPDLKKVSVVHVNPVFHADGFAPKNLGPEIPCVGIRNAEDLLTMLGFARFAEGCASLSELESYLGQCSQAFLGRQSGVV